MSMSSFLKNPITLRRKERSVPNTPSKPSVPAEDTWEFRSKQREDSPSTSPPRRPSIPPRTCSLYDDVEKSFIDVHCSLDPSMHNVDIRKFIAGDRKRTSSLGGMHRAHLPLTAQSHHPRIQSKKPNFGTRSDSFSFTFSGTSFSSTSEGSEPRTSASSSLSHSRPRVPMTPPSDDLYWAPRVNRSSPVRLPRVTSHPRKQDRKHPASSPPSITSFSMNSTTSSLSEESPSDLEEEGDDDWPALLSSALSLFPQPPPFTMPGGRHVGLQGNNDANSTKRSPSDGSSTSSSSGPPLTPDTTPIQTPPFPAFPHTPPRSILKKPSISFFSIGALLPVPCVPEAEPQPHKQISEDVVEWGLAV